MKIFTLHLFLYTTFPVRSILTVPWIELGGTVEIRCPQTGYHATIEFLTKPFYGGKRNKVTAEVCTYLKKIYIYIILMLTVLSTSIQCRFMRPMRRNRLFR